MLLENVRFCQGEEENDPDFAKTLASMAEIYVNDAFGAAHRAHASTAGVAKYIPAVCGFLMEKEITIMGQALSNPKRPFIAILGGSKVADKIGVITNLLDKVDTFMIGGGMAYTFMNALGYSIGNSICETDKLELAKDLVAKAKEKDVKILIPLDNVIGEKFEKDTPCRVVDSTRSPKAGWAWTSVPKPWPPTPRPCKGPAPSSGTDPWACLNGNTLPAAPWAWPKRWQKAAPFPSSAAGIRPLR